MGLQELGTYREAIANSGDFRMPIEEARKSGSSDPRNATMLKILSFVNIGERAGSGMGTIEGGWTAAGYLAPTVRPAPLPLQ